MCQSPLLSRQTKGSSFEFGKLGEESLMYGPRNEGAVEMEISSFPEQLYGQPLNTTGISAVSSYGE
jgi:hypothetical protein